ncbi:MAG: hypothetical protein V4539_06500 [Bacteroidota bacterium]
MNDNKFDDFVNNKLNEYAAPVPAGLWEKVAEGQLDQFIGSKLKDAEAPVPNGLWEKITDNQFDNFVSDKIEDHQAPVPGTLWDRITDGQFDNFVAGKLDSYEAPVPAGLWDRVTDGQFDAFVAGKLIDHEAPVPAGLWEKVRPEEDNRRVGFFWFRYPAAAALILAILSAAAWGGYMYFTRLKTNKPAETTQTTAPTNSNAGNNTPVTVTPKPTDNAAIVPPVANDAKTNALPGAEHPSNANAIPLNNSANISKEKTNRASSEPANNEKRIGAERSSSGENTVASPNTTGKGTGNKLLPPPPVNNNDFTSSSYDPFKNKTVAADKSTDQTSVKEPDVYLEPFQPSFTSISTIPFSLTKFGSFDKQLSTLNHTNQFRNVIICPSDKGGNRDWFVELYASPDIAMRSVTNGTASSLYMQKKDSSEAMQIGYSAGVRLVKPITDNILLKAGLNYSQVNQKYVYRTENEVKTTTVVSVRTIIRAPGDTVIVRDTSILQTVGFKNNTVSNRFRSFDIPVTIGYQFGDDDLKFGINAGVVLNISSWYQGVMLDTSLAVVPLNKSGNGVYKTNIGMGLYGSVSVVKRLSEGMHLFVEPYFRYNLSDMTTPQAGFKQKINIGGLAVGLRFNLNSKY